MSFGLSIDDLIDGKRPANTSIPRKSSTLANGIKEKTSKAIPDYPGSPLKLGSKGKDIERVQRASGIPESEVDGRYGPDTVAAVKAYQKRKGLFVDGIVGQKTWEMMF
ncbi:peptidoglycan-binding protein (plasmid) [Peribacillus frigoritolerans]|nr:peptidoglycan-binding protein [Peribacillus frigoritolerans]USK77839.1 peptidoglycan-binding protein [Peribacillus frigoritolerans]USK77926.1 peptidoglycan-binding protein [Peribacillus frigoritolerans]